MSFIDMVKTVQAYSGLGYSESKEALIMFVEITAAGMDDKSRQKFAAKLPEKLSDIALSVFPRPGNSADIVGQFMYYQNIGKSRARRQILATQQAIMDTIGKRTPQRIRREVYQIQ